MGAIERKFVAQGVEKLLAEATAEKMLLDVVGRHLIESAIGIWRQTRSSDDIASELQFMIDNMDDDKEYPFMRP